MIKKQLEIRGISRVELSKYLLQIGASKEDSTSTSSYKGNGWSCKMSSEESFRMFQSNIPKVFVTFEAIDSTTLEGVITKFRKKTFRAGG